VPEPKVVKNRVHICLNVQALGDEVERLICLGATKAEGHSSSSGKRWVVMRDPEGNEFCLVPVARTWPFVGAGLRPRGLPFRLEKRGPAQPRR
jgi:hypothetical protein